MIRDKIVVRTYRGSQEAATKAYRTDSGKMAEDGYVPTSQVWSPGTYGCGAFLVALLLCFVIIGILIFIYMLIVKPDGTLSVTYEWRGDTVAASPRASPPQVTAAPKIDRSAFAEEFTKLAKLRDQGVLTEAEFAEMKAALIKQAQGTS